MNRLSKLAVLSIVAMTMFCGNLIAQEDKGTQKSELAVRQRLVERKMVELEARFTAAAERIREKDPKRADRLIKTYQESKEKSLSKKMKNVSELLDEGSFAEADKELDDVIQVLESMIRLLTNDKEKPVSKKEEIETLEKFKKEIQKQLEEQRKQTAENKKVGNKKKAIDNLKAQIKQLEGLIKKQNDNIADTKANVDSGLRQLDKIADRQFQIRKETEELANAIREQKLKEEDPGKAEEQKPNDGKPGDGKAGKPGDNKPPKPGSKEDKELKELQKKKEDLEKKMKEEAAKKQGQPGDGNPGEKKDGKPGEKKDGKPGDGKAGKPGEKKDGKSGEGKSGQGKSGQSKSGKSGQKKAQQPGSKPLDKASEKQRMAEEKLASGKPKDAARQQEVAKQELEKALKELKKEKRRLESLPPEAVKRLADKQRRTRKKTMDILEEMKKAPKSKGDEKQDGGKQGQKPNAGQKPAEQAGGAMKKAADNLEKNDSKKAEQDQKKAEEKLEEAIEELEERLKQLREETREEKLARLEARFSEMLQRQQVASIVTIELDDKRTNLGQIRRRDQLSVLRMATEELQIQELGQQAYDLLVEDGTSVVFPEVVADLKIDLLEASQLLQEEKTSQYTQLVQKEIETTIEDLIDALKAVSYTHLTLPTKA